MTGALIILDEINATGIVNARRTFAIVHVVFAVLTAESGVAAIALVRIDSIDAKAFIETRGRLAFVDINFAS